MPKFTKRHKTQYPGVYYVESTSPANGKPERIYNIIYRRDGKNIEEKAGRQFQDDMTPSRAAAIRALKINRDRPTNKELRSAQAAEKDRQLNRWTFSRLFDEYVQRKPDLKSLAADRCNFNKYLLPAFGDKEPSQLNQFEIDKLRINLLKSKSPQTVKHVLALLRRLARFGVQKDLCSGISFQIEMPSVDNEKTEDLTDEQLSALLNAINLDTNVQAGNMMKLALYTGMRRGELFRLKWEDVDFQRGFINIRDPKGGRDQKIPLNNVARSILESHPRQIDSPYIFPGSNGKQRTDIIKQVNRIKQRAGLPADFRPLHGLRHVYASLLASSGQVDMYTLQKLLTHKSPLMTQRYAHLRDETLQKASNLIGQLINDDMTNLAEKKVLNLDNHKK